jgi:ComF family protein
MGDYAGVLGQLIRAAKYRGSLAAADQLAFWLGERISGVIDVDAIVPIPTPWFRRMRRGFDQSDRLARGVAQASGLERVPLLFRSDSTRQVGKGAAERRQLSPKVFGLRDLPMPSRVLLVDDVVTTGATLHAASRQLQRHGVEAVWAAVVADSVA